jgi:hypothetical protein
MEICAGGATRLLKRRQPFDSDQTRGHAAHVARYSENCGRFRRSRRLTLSAAPASETSKNPLCGIHCNELKLCARPRW